MKTHAKASGIALSLKRHRGAFTLIELLVVVAVILILASIGMKTMTLVNRKTGIARTTWILEQVKNALAGYYAVYGSYPPSDRVSGDDTVTYTAVPEYIRARYSSIRNSGESYGLTYFLTPDNAPWANYMVGIVQGGGILVVSNATYELGPVPQFTNTTSTIQDAWGNPLWYECTAGSQYQVCRLWSEGPNGDNDNGVGDDIGVTPGE